MTEKLVELIIATELVAAGIDIIDAQRIAADLVSKTISQEGINR